MIFQAVSIFIFSVYGLLILAITVGWWRLKSFKAGNQPNLTKVSVVVAMRNEGKNVYQLLNSLLLQNYPDELLEIILVDDHSTDKTLEILQSFKNQVCGNKYLNIISLGENTPSGKKAALHAAIQASGGQLIVVTDADCLAGKDWIRTVVSFFEKHNPQLILGPVKITDGGTWFGKLQSLEFTSLIASAAGSCHAGFPILSNGANLAFARDAYESCGGFVGNLQFPSGDDMFLLMEIKKKFGAKSIQFIRSAEAIVETPFEPGLRDFLNQRKRWVSKSRGYSDPFLIGASITVFLANLWLIVVAFSPIVLHGGWKLLLGIYFFKLLVDLPLMLGFSRFQKNKPLLWLFPFMEIANAIYTIFIGIAGNLGRFEWKGRKFD